jgi:hypothetical protein
VGQHAQLESLALRVRGAERSLDLLDLPVDDCGQDDQQAARRARLLLEVPLIGPSPPAVVRASRESVELLALEKSPTNTPAEVRLV